MPFASRALAARCQIVSLLLVSTVGRTSWNCTSCSAMVLHMFMNAFMKKDSRVSQLSPTRCGGLDSTAVAVNFDFFVKYMLWITAGVWFTLFSRGEPSHDHLALRDAILLVWEFKTPCLDEPQDFRTVVMVLTNNPVINFVGTNKRTRDPHRRNFAWGIIEIIQKCESIGWQWPRNDNNSTWDLTRSIRNDGTTTTVLFLGLDTRRYHKWNDNTPCKKSRVTIETIKS